MWFVVGELRWLYKKVCLICLQFIYFLVVAMTKKKMMKQRGLDSLSRKRKERRRERH